MKKIGEGYYYNVYDRGNGRVLKRLKSRLRIFFYILISRKGNPDFFREFKNALRVIPTIGVLYQRLQKSTIPMELFGNPMFSDSINYEQDKVSIIGSILLKLSEEQSRKIIEDFILLTKTLWRYGISDEVYNFTINNGIDAQGKLVLIDFNEVTFDKAKIVEDIETQVWLRRWSYALLAPSLQKYYKNRMKEELTLENLDLLWGQQLR